MAFLILNGVGPHEEPDDQTYYEFDPGNLKIFKEIISLMALRKNGDRKDIEQKLVHLCADSLKKDPSCTKKSLFQLSKIKQLFSWTKNNRSKPYGNRNITNFYRPNLQY